ARKPPAGPREPAPRGEPRAPGTLPVLEPRPGRAAAPASSGNGAEVGRDETERLALALEGMHCASCVNTIEKALASVPGVDEASVNLGTAQAHVRGRGLDPGRLIAAVRESGYGAAPLDDAPQTPSEQEAAARRQTREILRRTLVAAALTVPV